MDVLARTASTPQRAAPNGSVAAVASGIVNAAASHSAERRRRCLCARSANSRPKVGLCESGVPDCLLRKSRVWTDSESAVRTLAFNSLSRRTVPLAVTRARGHHGPKEPRPFARLAAGSPNISRYQTLGRTSGTRRRCRSRRGGDALLVVAQFCPLATRLKAAAPASKNFLPLVD